MYLIVPVSLELLFPHFCCIHGLNANSVQGFYSSFSFAADREKTENLKRTLVLLSSHMHVTSFAFAFLLEGTAFDFSLQLLP